MTTNQLITSSQILLIVVFIGWAVVHQTTKKWDTPPVLTERQIEIKDSMERTMQPYYAVVKKTPQEQMFRH